MVNIGTNYVRNVDMLAVINMAVMPDKFNIGRICIYVVRYSN
jgi:hypothetical protein